MGEVGSILAIATEFANRMVIRYLYSASKLTWQYCMVIGYGITKLISHCRF